MTALILALGSLAHAEARPAQLGMVEGVVTGVPTGLALANVAVTLRPAEEPWYVVRRTDVHGVFRFSDLPAGVYTIEAEQAGYAGATVPSILVIPGVPVSEHLEMSASDASSDPRTDRPRPASARRT